MEHIRRLIDQVDDAIVNLLSIRNQLVAQIAREKSVNGHPVRDLNREASIMARIRSEARKQGLDPVVVEEIFRLIINDSAQKQEVVINGKKHAEEVSA